MDAWYDENLAEGERKHWFVRCSKALLKKHERLLAEAQAAAEEPWEPEIPEPTIPYNPEHPVFGKHLWDQFYREREEARQRPF